MANKGYSGPHVNLKVTQVKPEFLYASRKPAVSGLYQALGAQTREGNLPVPKGSKRQVQECV